MLICKNVSAVLGDERRDTRECKEICEGPCDRFGSFEEVREFVRFRRIV